jgi:hypothetical protein
MLKTSYEKIDHFGDCVVYIELLSLYFPQKIDLSQIKCIIFFYLGLIEDRFRHREDFKYNATYLEHVMFILGKLRVGLNPFRKEH